MYVGRPTKWGNPFVIGADGTRDQVLDKYVRWLGDQPELIREAREELVGKDLVCWCAPEPCHADMLLVVANPGPDSDALVRDLCFHNKDGRAWRKTGRRCPYCNAAFLTAELLAQHVRRANRTGFCLGAPPPRDETGTL